MILGGTGLFHCQLYERKARFKAGGAYRGLDLACMGVLQFVCERREACSMPQFDSDVQNLKQGRCAQEGLQKMKTTKARILVAALMLALVASIVPMGAAPMASSGDVLFNGGFENGFVANPACPGMVGAGWGCFNNGGTAAYGFYDDMWARTVAAGTHSQLIEINTKQIGGDTNRTAGIFQTVRVYPGAPYELSLKGMIRADERNTDDPWRYRVFVGFDYNGGTNWQAVSDWRELPWDTYYSRTDPGSFSSYSTQVTPSGQALTVFVRTERKWGTWYEETDFNLDSISLFGLGQPMPKPHPEPVHPAHGGKELLPASVAAR